MDSTKKDLLSKNRQKIVESIDIHDALFGLRKYLVFDYSDEKQVCDSELYPTDISKRSALLDVVCSRGNKGFWGFLHSVKSKAPNIFDVLHDSELVDVENCFVCQTEGNDLQCQNCLGLMNCINHPNIKTPVDLAYVLYELKRKNNTLMEENIQTEKINFKLSVECQSVNERYQKSNQNYQKFLEDKEKQFEGLLEEKREATLKNQKLIRDIGMLNERLKFLEKKKEILEEENKHFCANIDNEFYQKQTELSNVRIQNLESKIEELINKNKKVSDENLERQEKINISEKVLENQINGFNCKIRNLEQQISNQVDDIAKKDEELSYLWFINDKKSTKIQSLQKEIEDLFVKFQESNSSHENLEYEENIAHVILKNKFEVVYDENCQLKQKEQEYLQQNEELQSKLQKTSNHFITSSQEYSHKVNIIILDFELNLVAVVLKQDFQIFKKPGHKNLSTSMKNIE